MSGTATAPRAEALLGQLDADLKQAMRDRDEVAKLTLRAVKTALTELRTSGSAEHNLSHDDVLAVLKREAKRRRDTAAEFDRLGDSGRAAAELAELSVLERYLPHPMSEEEIEVIARRVVAELGATSPKQMGAVMAGVMAEVKAQADGKAVNQVVRRLLSNEGHG